MSPAVIAATATAVLVEACGTHDTQHDVITRKAVAQRSTPSTSRSSKSGSTAHVSLAACRTQYFDWQRAHMDATARWMAAASQLKSSNLTASVARLQEGTRTELPSSMPPRADPHGYWHQTMAQMTIAMATVRSLGGGQVTPQANGEWTTRMEILEAKNFRETNRVACVRNNEAGCPPLSVVLRTIPKGW